MSILSKDFPLIFDGAMGTQIASLCEMPSWQSEEMNLTDPELILSIHKAYLKAGAKAHKTNTFGLPAKAGVQSPDRQKKIISQAVHLLRQAIKECKSADAYVFADLGPIGKDQKPMEVYPDLCAMFLREHVDGFLFETLPDIEGMEPLFVQIKRADPQAFIIVSIAAGADGITASGKRCREVLKDLDTLEGVDAIGLNCHCGPAHLLHLLRDLPELNKPISIMPNAGYPTVTSRRTVYGGSPDYFAMVMEDIVNHGAWIVGGCCGTTPAHIEKLVSLLDQRKTQTDSPVQVRVTDQPQLHFPTSVLDTNQQNGKKSILVELDPPANDSISGFMEGASRLQGAGADLITIADNPIGRPRADSSLLACKIHRELGMEVLPHMTCRDRNLNAIRALLLGLSIEDIHHVLFVTGDPLPLETRDEVKTVFSFHSRSLAAYARSLMEEQICQPFHMFGALDVNARNFDVQLRLALEKEQNGIEGFLTQPVFSSQALENLKRARKVLRGKIYGGIMPIVSWKNGMFLKNEITGMDIPDEMIEQYKGLDREESENIALAISVQIAAQITPYTDGYYLMTPFQRIGLMEKLIRELKDLEV